MSTRTTSPAHALPGGRVPDAIAAPVRFRLIANAAEHPTSPVYHWSALAAYASELASLYFPDDVTSAARPIIADRLA